MSDVKLRSKSFRYAFSEYDKAHNATVSLYHHKLTLRDHLLIPRKPFFVEVIDKERYNEVLKYEYEKQQDAEDKYERIAFGYMLFAWVYENSKSNSHYPYLGQMDINPHNSQLLYSDSQLGKYVVELYCDTKLYAKLSQASAVHIETSKEYRYSIIVTEKSIKLYRIVANKYINSITIYHKFRLNDVEGFLNDRSIATELYTFPISLRKDMMTQLCANPF